MVDVRVGTRELKNKLSEYMRRVKAGQVITVTERGKPIGQIIPVKASTQERLQSVVNAGVAEWNGQKPKSYKPKAVNQAARQVSDLVTEDRE